MYLVQELKNAVDHLLRIGLVEFLELVEVIHQLLLQGDALDLKLLVRRS